LTRYLKKCRIVGLAGLVSLALSALPAAPAGATGCQPGSTNPNYCTVNLSMDLMIQDGTVTVTITATDPHLKVTLLRHRRTLITPFEGDVNGQVTIQFFQPTDPGRYEVKAVATANDVTTIVIKHFTIRKHRKHRF
jgi:hypothetical protein